MTTPAAGSLPLPRTPRTDPPWSTATMAESSDSLPGDLDALGRHVGHGARGRWFALGVVADSVRNFVAPRLVTVLVAAALIATAISLAL